MIEISSPTFWVCCFAVWFVGYLFGAHLNAKHAASIAVCRYSNRIQELVRRKRLTALQGLEVLSKDDAEYKLNGGA